MSLEVSSGDRSGYGPETLPAGARDELRSTITSLGRLLVPHLLDRRIAVSQVDSNIYRPDRLTFDFLEITGLGTGAPDPEDSSDEDEAGDEDVDDAWEEYGMQPGPLAASVSIGFKEFSGDMEVREPNSWSATVYWYTPYKKPLDDNTLDVGVRDPWDPWEDAELAVWQTFAVSAGKRAAIEYACGVMICTDPGGSMQLDNERSTAHMDPDDPAVAALRELKQQGRRDAFCQFIERLDMLVYSLRG